MDAQALANAMGNRLPLSRYEQLRPAFEDALRQAQCTTVNRAAMFIAQIGTESGGLQWMEELADGSEYEGRGDLGNIYPGDGTRFKGRGPIQVTGRHNYGELSSWAYQQGYVSSPTYFLDHPEELSDNVYGFLGAVWYWTVARDMNSYADTGDIYGATRAVNGGLHGIEDRIRRWDVARSFGANILPGEDMAIRFTNSEGHEVDESTFMYWADLRARLQLEQLVGPGRKEDGTPNFGGWPQLNDHTLVDAVAEIGKALGLKGYGKQEEAK